MPLTILRRAVPGWGYSYGPAGNGPFPAVLVLHGSEGAWSGWSHRSAAILAAHGFLAMPHGYSKGGNPWNAGSIIDVPLDRTAEALDAIRASESAGPKVGIYGVSRGAEHALLLTALMAREGLSPLPDAVAAHAPSDVICGGFHAARWRDRGDPGWQAWDPADRAWTWRGSSEGLLPTLPIEIERYPGPLFLSHGTDDPIWPADTTRRLERRLHGSGRTGELEVHYYDGQSHLPEGDWENTHHERLIAFLRRHLTR